MVLTLPATPIITLLQQIGIESKDLASCYYEKCALDFLPKEMRRRDEIAALCQQIEKWAPHLAIAQLHQEVDRLAYQLASLQPSHARINPDPIEEDLST